MTPPPPHTLPSAAPFLLPGGPTGCLLLHGFTCHPDEMRGLGDFLAGRGCTVLGLRLPGHGTYPEDLLRLRFRDLLVAVEDGLAILGALSQRQVLIGQSMGGMLSLIAAARYPVAAVAALSTPYYRFSPAERRTIARNRWLHPLVRKPTFDRSDPLGDRREPDYPAYPQYPTRVLLEMIELQDALRQALPHITVPTLVLQSRHDPFIPPDSAEQIYARLGTADKQIVMLDGLGHAVVRDPLQQQTFDHLAAWLETI